MVEEMILFCRVAEVSTKYSLLHVVCNTVSLKSKLTLETRTLRLDPQVSILETFEDRVLSIESRVSRIEDRETRLSRICKNSKGFRENDLFLEGRIIQHCSHLNCKRCASIVTV